jgi:hypothetical protein
VTTRLPGTRAIAIAIGAALLIGALFTAAPAAVAANGSSKLVLKRGVGTKGKSSVRVRAVQHALQRHGFRVRRADGRYGRRTRAAVRRFQRREGLHATGVVNAQTRRALGLTARFNRARPHRAASHRAAHRRAPARRVVPAPPRKAPADPPVTRTQASGAHASAPPAGVPPSAAVAPATESDAVADLWPGGVLLLTALSFTVWLLVRPAPAAPERYRVPALAFAGAASIMDALPAVAGGVPDVGAMPEPEAGEAAAREREPEAGEAGAHEPEPDGCEAATSEPPPAPAPHDRARFERSTAPAMAAVAARAHATTPAAARPRPRPLGPGDPVIAYVDLNAGARGRSARKIERTCARAGWDLLEVVVERGDRRTGDRPGLAYALERIERGEAKALVVRDRRDLGRRSIARRACTRRLRLARAALVTCVPGGEPVIEHRGAAREIARRQAA